MTHGIAGFGVARPPAADVWSLEELTFRAASAALEAADLTRADIDGVCVSGSDQLDGRLISSMHLAGPAGGFLKDEIKIAEDGIGALAAAILRLETGVSDRVLVVAWCKASESDHGVAETVNPHPVFERQVGLHPLMGEAILAQQFLASHGLEVHHLDAAAGGAGDDGADFASWPLRHAHIPPPTDAAVALVVARDEAPVRLTGFEWRTAHPDPLARRHGPLETLSRLSEEVAQHVGFDPRTAGVVESTDRNTFRLLLTAAWLEGLDPHEIVPILSGEGLERLNPSGGLWVSNPLWAAGLERVVEAASRVRSGTERAVAHASYGRAGQSQAVAVLEGG
jgi:hypothetical protein